MRAGLTAMVIICYFPAAVLATTLRLSGDIDLLVLDGKKVSSSLLRGAESIELENGPHQLVFRVEKTISLNNHQQILYTSPALIASFDTQNVNQVNFSLPEMNTQKQAEQFNTTPRVALLDGNATPIPVRLDVLETDANIHIENYEIATERYNKSGKIAALSRPAQKIADDSTLLSGISELDIPPSQTFTEQRLKYWYQKADPATRKRFIEWTQHQPAS
ncbi:curli synthesis inhibitor [Vagococcus sp. WN89Y]|uniref:curli synthesis inhibitor n=1 Tax=Vagococcus sp. WN89Y TaxID=3457258 RepID=UPI003FCED131